MENILIELLKNAPSTGIIVVMLWYGQKSITDKIDKMSRRMDCFESSQHICQLDIAKHYATKDELQSVEGKLDKRVSRLESK